MQWSWCCLVLIVLALVAPVRGADPRPAKRPNILWISAEDLSPDLGCYGDGYALTPNLDAFAASGARFDAAFATAPVCSPSRSTIITGVYAPSLGTHHHRSNVALPPHVKPFPAYLRAAGYYCTNNVKTDYNFKPPADAWDESSNKAHWRNRSGDQPFFAVFNFTTTHEGQTRAPAEQFEKHMARVRPEDRRDPAKAVLPPYYPDTPVVRRNWANYYDLITSMDAQVAELLKELDDAGLADDTIVFFWGDHGRGLSRGKRWCYDSGVRVPLIVRWPGKVERGSVRTDLVSLVDLAPTVLSLAGVEVPSHMQGQVFLGDSAAGPRKYVYVHRDRMDETTDTIRAVRDGRFKYIRNLRPELPYAQRIGYMDQMPIMQEWRRLAAAGELSGPAALFFAPTKPAEELYDTQADPHEVNNLAGAPEHRETLERLRAELDRWMKSINDPGAAPEDPANRADERPRARRRGQARE